MLSQLSLACYGFLILFVTPLEATIYVQSNASFPANITSACSSALTADLACPDGIQKMRQGLYYPQSFLTSLCTSTCSSSLSGYAASVKSACEGETYDSLTSLGNVPLYTIPQLLGYFYNYSCLVDSSSGQYCNVQNANAIGITADQSNLNSINGGGALNCTDCNLKQLQFLAGAAYYHDDNVVSVYSSLTSSCHATTYSLTSSTLGFNTTPTATTTVVSPSPSCTGSMYSIQPGDTCQSISRSQGVATMWLLLDNNLPAYCAEFPTSGSLCIQHKCTTYTVQGNDTCTSIEKASKINYAQILAWNPQFDLTCSNINMTVGLEICISSPGPAYTPPTTISASVATSSATTAVAVPSNAASGSTTDCAQWYEAVPGDYCNLIIIRWGISLADFLILNPEVNENCTNLFAYESYCMEPVGDMSNYPGAPGYIGSIPAWTTIPATLLPTATYIPGLYSAPNITYANGTRRDCAIYIDGSDYQEDLSNTTFVSQCDVALAVFSISFADLTLWNPSLAKTSISNCSFAQTLSYCVQWSSDHVTTATSSAVTALPTGSGTVANCTQWTFADSDVTCDIILQVWDITLSWFVSLNPEVGTDCGGFQQLTYYCVNTTASVSTISIPPSSTTSTVTPPGPTQSGIPSNCNKYYVVQSGDTCSSVEAAYGITDAEFHAWNPAVSSDCLTNFWSGEAYCVGVSGGGTTAMATTTTAGVSTSTATTSVTPPGPTMSGIPANCNKYYLVQSGDSCSSVEAAFSITDAEFHAWNPTVSSDCLTNFWIGEAYCVGVSGASALGTTTSASKTTSVTPPGPTMSGIPANCNKYYLVQSGDSCSSVEAEFGITDAQFHAWNPTVSSDCLINFWVGEAYCVGVS